VLIDDCDYMMRPLATRFSDDGRWWWNGDRWIATSDVQLPQLPITEFERSGALERSRRRMKRQKVMSDMFMVETAIPTSSPLSLIGGALVVPFLVLERRAFRDYRTWTLQQLVMATEFLLGPDAPMMAGETAMYRSSGLATRDLTVAVTADHVVVFRIDSLDGQPRWIALAARCADVKLEAQNMGFGTQPSLVITRGDQNWVIRGYPRVFDPRPVLDAWRRSALTR
jgi:hypothetical protein